MKNPHSGEHSLFDARTHSLNTSERALFERGEACLSSDEGVRAIAFDGVGKEDAGAHKTQYCCNRIDHRERFIVLTWASVFCFTNSGRCLAAGQLHVGVVALDLGMIGDN